MSIDRGRPDQSGHTVGCVRTLPLPDGGSQRERLLALSDLDHSCAFTITDGPVPLVTTCRSSDCAGSPADDTTFVEWVGPFDVADADADQAEAEVCNTVMTVCHAGLQALTDRFAER